MNPRKLSIMVGIFSVLNTIQFLIFDLNQLTEIGYEDSFSIYLPPESKSDSWAKASRYNISLGLSITTLLVSCFLLYCIRMDIYVGLLIYALWIAAYELTSFSVVLLIKNTIKELFLELTYLYLIMYISRMLLHFFCLPFVVKHAYTLYKERQAIRKERRRRTSSLSILDRKIN
ncbi:transmembrane protein 217B [Microcebus murinus]|uniref:transmembrane protein 217B n=1 Tax=Microcebus murinus TaxID=30608 RepID=UPI00064294AA|nr:transmembrane protein 217 isoform X2 [Microcebus murinus]XP_012602317.1 transmembrane protein 217 isoform X2 [Microcebus murinus]XP_012602318.1 transmembrane protein 217 isoform X2 [Microcebus murinus]XP_012602319.1 transmembrane protein 217 isoform X2 [Microcebus murinus]